MISTEEFEDHILPKLLANEVSCKTYLNELVKRGLHIEINGQKVDHTKVCHEHAIEILIKMYADMKRREKNGSHS